jgi:23S rRNA pseudouridine2605 synthase
MQERLQKIIARAGLASRRAGEELILAGRVRVNGTIVTELGAKADMFVDKVEVDGARLVAEAPRYIVLHKPRNVVSTLADPEGRPTVADLLRDVGGRIYPVGRLDFATSGVLLATNDGDFANALLHPRGGVPKTYVLKVHGNMGEEDLIRWATGVQLDDGVTLPADVRILRHEDDKTWLEVTLREGRNQQIRRMGEATGFPVMRLARLSFAGVTSEGLRPGEWRPISVDELLDIRKHFGVPKKVRMASMAGPIDKPGRHGPDRTDRSARPSRGPAARPERGGSPTQRGLPRAEPGAARPEREGARALRRDAAGPSREGPRPSREVSRPSREATRLTREGSAHERRSGPPVRAARPDGRSTARIDRNATPRPEPLAGLDNPRARRGAQSSKPTRGKPPARQDDAAGRPRRAGPAKPRRS